MVDYNLEKQTVTLTIDEFADLVANSTAAHLQQAHPRQGMAGARDGKLTIPELEVFALRLMEDENESDYNLYIASAWLHHHIALREADNIAEWVAVARDLEQQLQLIYQGNN